MVNTKTPIGKRNGINVYSRLTSKTPLKAHKGLNKVSEKQRAKNKAWKKVTEQKAHALGYICQWCLCPLQQHLIKRIDGHHIIKRRYNIHTIDNCYIVIGECHSFIEDNNIDVRVIPDKYHYKRDKQGKIIFHKPLDK
jgi:hypothetical protein